MIAIFISVSLLLGGKNVKKEKIETSQTVEQLEILTEWIERDVNRKEINAAVGGDYIENIKDVIILLENKK
jgi:hypothetical protein